MNTQAKLTAKDDIKREYKSTHTTDPNWDNYNSTVHRLFTKETTKLNKQLGL